MSGSKDRHQQSGNCTENCCLGGNNSFSTNNVAFNNPNTTSGGSNSDHTGLLSQTARLGTVQSTYGSFSEVVRTCPTRESSSSEAGSLTSLESSNSTSSTGKHPLLQPQNGDMVSTCLKDVDLSCVCNGRRGSYSSIV